MNPRKFGLAALVAVAAGGGGTGAWLERERTALTAAIGAAQRETEAASRRTRELRARAEALEREAAAVPVAPKAATPAPQPADSREVGTTPPGSEAERRRRREALARWVEEKRQPEGQAAELAWHETRQRLNYEAFCRQRALPAEVERQFHAAYRQREARHLDLNAATRELGLEANDPAVAKLRGEIFREHREELRALLGEPGYAALQDYERTTAARSVARAIAATATLAGTPLDAPQLERVIGAIAAASESYARGHAVTAGDVDWRAVQARLPEFLSPAQVAAVTAQEGGSGLFHSWWNAELVRATRTPTP